MKNFKIVWHRSDAGTYERIVKTRSLGQCAGCARTISDLISEVTAFEIYRQGSLGDGMWILAYTFKR